MGVEIERKFLVDKKRWQKIKPTEGLFIAQGYLHNSKDKTVRVRTKGEKGFLTIKGATDGISRTEFEYVIPKKDAEELLCKFCPKRIEKTRYLVEHNGKTWEVDEFDFPNSGLILAEVELNSVEEQIALPEWVTEDVSDNPAYFNSNML